jgi:hypothetical protein
VSQPAESPPDLFLTDEADEPHPRKREFSSPFAFVGVVVVGALVVIGCVLGTTMSGLFRFDGDAVNAANADPTSSASPGQRVAGTSFSDGQWLVSGDIQPGTYSVTVPVTSGGCTWERTSSTDGTASAVLESGVGKSGQDLVVGIKSTDKVFQSNGCGTWQRTGDEAASQDQNYTDNEGGGTED